uniref:60S ribosomal protein L36 n=1 Tax=Alexandrium andersonii TaxID=327968 RepID=A0A7S2FXS6_9DINO|mmetsp:Transcript_36029/g.81896  ORF Transcript_36029/g.81896 Transcript_36029/m.81896 type:complete len:115 (+) Transcript_36029:73-417(+)
MGKELKQKAPKPEPTGLAAGLNKGFIVTRREMPMKPSHRKGKLCERVKLIREVVREVVGFAPYERRMIELLKVGSAAAFKRALKLAKKRLGTHRRGKKKREEMSEAVSAMRRKG